MSSLSMSIKSCGDLCYTPKSLPHLFTSEKSVKILTRAYSHELNSKSSRLLVYWCHIKLGPPPPHVNYDMSFHYAGDYAELLLLLHFSKQSNSRDIAGLCMFTNFINNHKCFLNSYLWLPCTFFIPLHPEE